MESFAKDVHFISFHFISFFFFSSNTCSAKLWDRLSWYVGDQREKSCSHIARCLGGRQTDKQCDKTMWQVFSRCAYGVYGAEKGILNMFWGFRGWGLSGETLREGLQKTIRPPWDLKMKKKKKQQEYWKLEWVVTQNYFEVHSTSRLEVEAVVWTWLWDLWVRLPVFPM